MPKFVVTNAPAKPLSTRNADDFIFKSSVDGPISDMTVIQRGLLFAETAMMSYFAEEQFKSAIQKIGLSLRASFFSQHGLAHLLESESDMLVLFRGTSEHDWEDLEEEQQEEKNAAIFSETVGKVNHCFKEDVDHLWPQIETELETNRKPVWFVGHSLGGAFAIICANRCLLSYIRTEPAEVHTFGAPRVGTKKYVRHVNLKHYRWVNNNDFVTRVPAAWLGYRHCGEEMYIDYQGKLRTPGNLERAYNNSLCFIKSKIKGKRHREEDHSIVQYVKLIFELYRQQKSNRPQPSANSKH